MKLKQIFFIQVILIFLLGAACGSAAEDPDIATATAFTITVEAINAEADIIEAEVEAKIEAECGADIRTAKNKSSSLLRTVNNKTGSQFQYHEGVLWAMRTAVQQVEDRNDICLPVICNGIRENMQTSYDNYSSVKTNSSTAELALATKKMYGIFLRKCKVNQANYNLDNDQAKIEILRNRDCVNSVFEEVSGKCSAYYFQNQTCPYTIEETLARCER